MNQRLRELLNNSLLFTIGNFSSKLLVFLMVPLYTYTLSPSEFGTSDLIQSIVSMMIPFLAVCIADGVLRYCYIEEYSKAEIYSIGRKITQWGTIACSILTLLICQMSFFKDIIAYSYFIPLLFYANAQYNLVNKFARGLNRVKASTIAGVLSTFVMVFCNVLFIVVLKTGVFGYLLSMLLGQITSLLYLCIKCNTRGLIVPVNLRSSLSIKMLKYSTPLIPNSISWWLMQTMNRYIIVAFMGVSFVGYYAATMRIPTILTVLADIFASAWMLSALKGYGTDESKTFIKKMHERFFTLLSVLTGGIILLSKFLANLILLNNYSTYWNIIPYLFFSVFFGSLVGFIGAIYSAENRTILHFISTISGGVLTIVLTWLLIPKFGLDAVAWSTLIGYFVIWIVRRLTVQKYIDLGVSFICTVTNIALLCAESILVSKEYWLLSTLLFICLIIINIKMISNISMYVLSNMKILRHGKNYN